MEVGPVGYGIYDGLSGIALYLAMYNYYQEDESPFNILTIYDSIKSQIETSSLKSNFSAYYGLGSYVYLTEKLNEMGDITTDKALLVYEDFCRKLLKNLDAIQAVDFIGGLAGILKLLSLLYTKHEIPLLKQTADLVYKALISKAKVKNEDLMYWVSDSFEDTVLAGFSHGLTGICYSLSEYSVISSEETKAEIVDMITKTLRYEDLFFNNDEEKDRKSVV